MVMSFRVSELQVLLGFAGRNKSGRKQELLQRALQLVQKGTTMPVQIKIRELYRYVMWCKELRAFYSVSSSIITVQCTMFFICLHQCGSEM